MAKRGSRKGERREPPEGYVTLRDVVKRCKQKGVEVNVRSLEYRFDQGKIPGAIREPDDPKGRRLVAESMVLGVVLYYKKLNGLISKKRSLGDLARELGIEPLTFYAIAERRGIPTARIFNNQILTEADYTHWKDLLKKEMQEDKERQEKYVTASDLAREFDTSRYMVLYWIKTGKIPGEKIGNRYFISRKEYEAHKEEWKREYGCR